MISDDDNNNNINSDINNVEIQFEHKKNKNKKLNLKNKKAIINSISYNSYKEMPIIKPESNRTENSENKNVFISSSLNHEDKEGNVVENGNVKEIENDKNGNGNEIRDENENVNENGNEIREESENENENENINENENELSNNENNKPKLKRRNTLLDEINDSTSEATSSPSALNKSLLSQSQSSPLQKGQYKSLIYSVTDDEGSSLNDSYGNSKINNNIRSFLQNQELLNEYVVEDEEEEDEEEEEMEDEIEYEDESEEEEEEEEEEDMDIDVYEEDEEDEEDEVDEDEYDEYNEEEEEEEEGEDDIETEFLDSEYEFDEYNNYGYPGGGENSDYELNKSLGITNEHMGEYEYKNMIDVLRNLSYVVSKMRTERDTEKLSIRHFDSIMNEIKYSQTTCSEILLKAERISKKYSASLKELKELQAKFKKQNEQYKEEIKQINKKIHILRKDIAKKNINGSMLNHTEKWTNIILIAVIVVLIYTFLFILMSYFNVQQYTKPFVDHCLTYTKNISLNHELLNEFNRYLRLRIHCVYHCYENLMIKFVNTIQNIKYHYNI